MHKFRQTGIKNEDCVGLMDILGWINILGLRSLWAWQLVKWVMWKTCWLEPLSHITWTCCLRNTVVEKVSVQSTCCWDCPTFDSTVCFQPDNRAHTWSHIPYCNSEMVFFLVLVFFHLRNPVLRIETFISIKLTSASTLDFCLLYLTQRHHFANPQDLQTIPDESSLFKRKKC